MACLTANSWIASADGLRRAQHLAQWLARVASADGWDRGGPGILPDGSLAAIQRMVRRMPGSVPDGLRVSLRCICALADDSIREGPGVLHDGSLAALRRMVRIESGPASCPTSHSCRFGWFRFQTSPASCPTARSTTASRISLSLVPMQRLPSSAFLRSSQLFG